MARKTVVAVKEKFGFVGKVKNWVKAEVDELKEDWKNGKNKDNRKG